MSDFNRVAKINGYNMKKHLADTDPHPMYLKNTAQAVAEAIDRYLQDHPVQVDGALNDLTDVNLTDVQVGETLRYDAATGMWVNGTGVEGLIHDVTINGITIVDNNKTAVIPNANSETFGVTRFANANELANGTSNNVAVTPANVKTLVDNLRAGSSAYIVVFITGGTGAAWSLDNNTWFDSGDLVEASEGAKTIYFSVPNNAKPIEAIPVTLVKGEVLSITQELKTNVGTLMVNTDVPTATWTIDNWVTSHNNHDEVEVEDGAIVTVQFESRVPMYNDIEPVNVNIVAGSRIVINKEYPDASGTVTVEFLNTPTGAMFYVNTDPDTFYDHGSTVTLSPGSYVIHFVDIAGYDTPDPINVEITCNGKVLRTASYRKSQEPVYGVRYYDPETATPASIGNSSTELTGIVWDRNTGDKRVLGETEPWPCKLTAHDFHKCLLKNGQVNYYLDPADSTKKYNGTYNGKTSNGSSAVLTGADGDVMVEIQPVWFRVDFVGVDASGNSIYDWLVSKAEFEGSVLHPYFRVGRESTEDERAYVQYLGAYESVMCDQGTPRSTAGITSPIAIGTGTTQVTTANYTCRSVKGYKPVTNLTLEQFRIGHQRAGLHSMNSLAMQFLALMMFVEYRSLNSQSNGIVGSNRDKNLGCAGNRSDGFVWYSSSFQYKFVRNTGRADFAGNGTCEAEYSSDDTNDNLPDSFSKDRPGGESGPKIVGFTYRGIENPFGHIFKFEDGILTYSGGYYLTDMPSKYTSDVNTAKAEGSGYTTYIHSWPGSGYIKTFEFSEGMPTFFAKTTGGTSTTYLPDYLRKEDGIVMISNGGLGSIVEGGVKYDTSQQHTGICKKNCRDRLGDINTFKGSRSAFSIVAD